MATVLHHMLQECTLTNHTNIEMKATLPPLTTLNKPTYVLPVEQDVGDNPDLSF